MQGLYSTPHTVPNYWVRKSGDRAADETRSTETEEEHGQNKTKVMN